MLTTTHATCRCVFVRDGNIIARGSNKTNETRNPTRHAEFDAIDRILTACSGRVEDARFPECTLYVTCEPCIMCAGALCLVEIGEVVYGCMNDKFGGCGSILDIASTGCGGCGKKPAPQGFKSRGGLFGKEAVELLRHFYITGNPSAPKPHRKVCTDRINMDK